MVIFGLEPLAWFVLVAATLFRMGAAVDKTWYRVGFTGAVSIFAGYFFWQFALEVFGLSDNLKYPAMILCTLMGEGVGQVIITVSKDPAKVKELWDKWSTK